MFEIVKPCQICKSYVLKPKININFDLKKTADNIEKYSFEILAFTGSMLSLKRECKVNIYNSGKIAIITKGRPIALLVASSRIKIPVVPIINSTGIAFSPNVYFKRIPPLLII